MSARTEYDQELEKLHLNMIKMGGLIEEAIDKSIEAFISRDKNLAVRIIENDKVIDDLERAIETQCLRLLLKQQPVAGDLRAISTALKMITDMERIGDHASDIADVSLNFDNMPFVKTLQHIPLMAQISSQMVKESVNAFVKSDKQLALEVIERDDEVDNLFDKVKQDIVVILSQSSEMADQAVDFLQIAKYLERIGDHATNIAGWVIFSITGEHKSKRIL
jgi:phosphate transport system protein